MHCWEWHDFEDQTEFAEVDEHDPYSAATDNVIGEYITRSFWVGAARDGQQYTIGFQRILLRSLLVSFVGSDFLYCGKNLIVPESGGWLVNFNLSAAGLDYHQVELSIRAKRELFAGIACAVYDHYNVARAGLYCWYAARPELVELYDRALGFKLEPESKQKFIPHINKFNGLGDIGRGYAIITKYYSHPNC